MNPIPILVWTAQHDSTLLPTSLSHAERIADELLGQETESHNPIYDVYQSFAAEMLAWMDQQNIPKLGAQASLYSDLRSGGGLNATQFYFENFPRDHRPLYSQFLKLAQAHQLVVYDTAEQVVFLPDGASMPAAARQQLAALTRMYEIDEQNRNINELPTRFDQVPDWLRAQVDAHFAEYGFSKCVIQIDEDGAIKASVWKKTPAGLIILSVFVYERYGSLRIWGYVSFFFRCLNRLKKEVHSIDFKKITYMSGFEDFNINLVKLGRQSDILGVFFDIFQESIIHEICLFSEIPSSVEIKPFYDFMCKNYAKEQSYYNDNYFMMRSAYVLQPNSLHQIKDFAIKRYKNKLDPTSFPEHADDIDQLLIEIEPQYALLKSHGIPTLAADPAFYAEDLGVEDLILKGYKLI